MEPAAQILTPRRKRVRRHLPLLAGWGRDLFISLLIAAFIIIFLYQPVKVEGTSMLPGLDDQERIFINKFVYSFEPIERGDIVVFRYPRDPSKSYIKRVIAVGGDTVRIADGRLYVNGKHVPEPYVPSEFFDERSYPEMVVARGMYFLLGDHRSSSSDSREFGPVSRRYIYGKAVFGYWPVDKVGVVR
ncbi:MAG: signal peptidase I [Terriglobales bacterium]